jgi:hypothetical protein
MKRGYRTGWRTWKGPEQGRSVGPLVSEDWARDYNEIKALGGKDSKNRTQRQTEDAHFWLITGPVSYYPIVRQLVSSKNNLTKSGD